MTEQELRALVRDAIARHACDGAPEPLAPAHRVASPHLSHRSHAPTFTLARGADADGPCIIEPAVMCNHCGYCKSTAIESPYDPIAFSLPGEASVFCALPGSKRVGDVDRFYSDGVDLMPHDELVARVAASRRSSA